MLDPRSTSRMAAAVTDLVTSSRTVASTQAHRHGHTPRLAPILPCCIPAELPPPPCLYQHYTLLPGTTATNTSMYNDASVLNGVSFYVSK